MLECCGQALFGLAGSEVGQANELNAREPAANEALDAKRGRAGGVQAGSRNARAHV